MAEAALSTMWGIGRFPDLGGFFAAARELGFRRFELNHAVTAAMLDAVGLNGHRIPSIHEPCPAEHSLAELRSRGWLVSAVDEADRRRAVATVRRSIELAQRIGASVVVVHPGQVDVDPALERTLLELYREGAAGEPRFALARERLRSARAERAEAAMRSVRRSLQELAEHAAGLGVRLGLENRYHYHEIPQPDELEELLAMDRGEVIGYWHDVGHAEAMERLGFSRHEECLRRFAARIVGVHLHDIDGIKDHFAPGLGSLDWDMVARNLPSAALRTCEVQSFNPPREVIAGLRLLVDKGIMEMGNELAS